MHMQMDVNWWVSISIGDQRNFDFGVYQWGDKKRHTKAVICVAGVAYPRIILFLFLIHRTKQPRL